nr:hypothetical protein [Alicyclobacillus acidiphilus]
MAGILSTIRKQTLTRANSHIHLVSNLCDRAIQPRNGFPIDLGDTSELCSQNLLLGLSFLDMGAIMDLVCFGRNSRRMIMVLAMDVTNRSIG